MHLHKKYVMLYIFYSNFNFLNLLVLKLINYFFSINKNKT